MSIISEKIFENNRFVVKIAVGKIEKMQETHGVFEEKTVRDILIDSVMTGRDLNEKKIPYAKGFYRRVFR